VFGKPLVLVVGSDSADTHTVHRLPASAGFGVELAASGQAGVRRFERGGLAAAVVGWHLGAGISGLELVGEVRRQDAFFPVILLARVDSPGDKAAALRAGADDHLVAPFDPDVLVARIQLLARRRSALPGQDPGKVAAVRGKLPPLVRLGRVELDLRTGTCLGQGGRTMQLGGALLDLVEYLMRSGPEPRNREQMARDLGPMVSAGAMGERVRAIRHALRVAGETNPESVLRYHDGGRLRGYRLYWSDARSERIRALDPLGPPGAGTTAPKPRARAPKRGTERKARSATSATWWSDTRPGASIGAPISDDDLTRSRIPTPA
jgi:DNA-binding response OmpR family regulator